MRRPSFAPHIVVLPGVAGSLFAARNAEALPAFTRKYKLGCNVCHTFYPQLNRFGRDFRDNGLRMPDEVREFQKKPSAPTPPAVTTMTGHGAALSATQAGAASDDVWSFVPEQIPFRAIAQRYLSF